MRINRSRLLIALIVVSLWWTISMFVAPYMVAPGTVKDLNGRANIIDFPELWNKMSPYPRVIYYFGDLNCHQISNRTLYLNSNEMPVCSRDVSIFVFVNFGFIASMLVTPSSSISEGVLNLMPLSIRKPILRRKYGSIAFALVLLILLLLPTAIDGFRQMLTPYESTNVIRVLTGAPCGFAGGFYLGVMIVSVGEVDKAREMLKKDKEKE